MKKLALYFTGLVFTLVLGVTSIRYYSAVSSQSNTSDLGSLEEVSADSLTTPESSPYIIFTPLSVDRIFDIHREPVSSDMVTLVATGDVIPARVTDIKIRARGVNYPFENVKEYLQKGDITVANLESPLVSGCPARNEGMVFCGIPDFGNAMKENGVSLVTLENNHIGNYGIKGIEETKQRLSQLELEFVTKDQIVYRKIKGIVFAFIAFNGVGPEFNKEDIELKVGEMRKKADVVVASVHWGKEYTYNPERAGGIAPDDPREIGHLLIDSGADLVIGNHPHWVQGVELYKDGFITYAHGNFIFDQEWSRETKEGVLGNYIFSKGKLIDVYFTPVIIEDYAKPRIATEAESQKILTKMLESSQRLMQ